MKKVDLVHSIPNFRNTTFLRYHFFSATFLVPLIVGTTFFVPLFFGYHGKGGHLRSQTTNRCYGPLGLNYKASMDGFDGNPETRPKFERPRESYY